MEIEWEDLGKDSHRLIFESAFGVDKNEGGDLKFIMVGEVGEWWAKVWLEEEKAWQLFRRVCKGWREMSDRLFPFHRSHAMLRATAGGNLDSLKMMLKIPELNPVKTNFIKIAAALGYHELVRVLMKDPRVDPSADGNTAIQSAAWYGHYEAAKALLEDERVNPTVYSLHFACKVGNLNLVKLLLKDPRAVPSSNHNQAFRNACKHGNTDVVAELLLDERVDPTDRNNVAIQDASQRGFHDIVKLLLDDGRVSPESNNNFSIQVACTKGHEKVVELLMNDPRVDPSSRADLAIRRASFNGHDSVVQLLLKDKRVDPSKIVNHLSCGETNSVELIT